MYTSTNTANVIKHLAKSKGISITKMLLECGLNKNTLSTMTSRGSWIQANSLAQIADYLDCSVDYLLWRTSIPEINKCNTSQAGVIEYITDLINKDKLETEKLVAYGGKVKETQPPIDEKTTL